jgi:DNA (cytosine-5)-methyltransferase 1
MGYHRAGFEVVGVDIRPQPRYPFEFIQADALEVLRGWICLTGGGFDAIHASPPCQAYAAATFARGDPAAHAELIPPTRALLEVSGLPWVIENLPEAPIRRDFLLCGSMFGLEVRRHRAFETNWSRFELVAGCAGHAELQPFMHKGERAYADAMGCEWMTKREARQAIPPAFTEHIGRRLATELEAAAA